MDGPGAAPDPVRVSLRKHFVTVAIVAAMATVFSIAAWSTWGWPIGRPSSDDALIWTAAIAAIGTLAAVLAALRNADAATDNALIALRIARENADRAEQMRHEEVRPYFAVQAWWERYIDSDGVEFGRVRVRVIHEAGGTAFGLTILLVPLQAAPNFAHYTIISGVILRPLVTATFGKPKGHYGTAEYASDSDRFTIGTRWRVVCRSQDAYGWWWEQRSALVELAFWQSAGSSSGTYELPLTMEVPSRVSGPYPDEAELRALHG